jgi:hypothetical protein
MRLPVGSAPTVVALLLEGKVVNQVRLEAGRWHPVHLSIRGNQRRFMALSLRGAPTVWVGRANARELR